MTNPGGQPLAKALQAPAVGGCSEVPWPAAPLQLPRCPKKPALSPPQEKLWADMEQRESRLAITQLISAM